jgi:hypothetical protein
VSFHRDRDASESVLIKDRWWIETGVSFEYEHSQVTFDVLEIWWIFHQDKMKAMRICMFSNGVTSSSVLNKLRRRRAESRRRYLLIYLFFFLRKNNVRMFYVVSFTLGAHPLVRYRSGWWYHEDVNLQLYNPPTELCLSKEKHLSIRSRPERIRWIHLPRISFTVPSKVLASERTRITRAIL